MKAIEFNSRIRNNRILIPAELQSQLKDKLDKDVRVIVLIDETDADDELTYRQTAQSQFLNGYADSDSIYDNM